MGTIGGGPARWSPEEPGGTRRSPEEPGDFFWLGPKNIQALWLETQGVRIRPEAPAQLWKYTEKYREMSIFLYIFYVRIPIFLGVRGFGVLLVLAG